MHAPRDFGRQPFASDCDPAARTEGLARPLLLGLGIDIDALRERMPIMSGPPVVGEVPLTADAREAIEIAGARARSREDSVVTVVDLLVGIVDTAGVGAELLTAAGGVSPATVRQAISGAETSARPQPNGPGPNVAQFRSGRR